MWSESWSRNDWRFLRIKKNLRKYETWQRGHETIHVQVSASTISTSTVPILEKRSGPQNAFPGPAPARGHRPLAPGPKDTERLQRPLGRRRRCTRCARSSPRTCRPRSALIPQSRCSEGIFTHGIQLLPKRTSAAGGRCEALEPGTEATGRCPSH